MDLEYKSLVQDSAKSEIEAFIDSNSCSNSSAEVQVVVLEEDEETSGNIS